MPDETLQEQNPNELPQPNIEFHLIPGGPRDPLASRKLRLAGTVIDGLLALLVLLPVVLLSRLLHLGQQETTIAGWAATLSFALYQWHLIVSTGQSLAKRWLGTQIVRVDGKDLDFFHTVFLRSLLLGSLSYAASTFLALPYLGFGILAVNAVMIFGDKRQCLNDRIAGTQVISLD